MMLKPARSIHVKLCRSWVPAVCHRRPRSSAVFMDAFSAENKLLKKASLDEMKKAQPSAFWDKLRNPALSFGLGWDITGLPRYDAAGVQILGKSGGTGNY